MGIRSFYGQKLKVKKDVKEKDWLIKPLNKV